MKAKGISYRGICEYVNADGIRCSQLAYKAGERYCIHHDIAELIAQAPRKYAKREQRQQIGERYLRNRV